MTSSSPQRDTFGSPAGSLVLIASVALLAAVVGYVATLNSYFVGDDFAFVGRYATFPFSEWPGLFTRTWQAGLFSFDLREIRPLNALAFMMDGWLWGADPSGYRVTNLLLHAGCAALVGLIALQLANTRRPAVLATLLFAFHPVAVPAVGWITGRVDLLSTLLMLGGAFAWLRHRRDSGPASLVVLGLCFAGGVFTKESVLVFSALALLLDAAVGGVSARWRDPRGRRAYFVIAGVLALYFTCRFLAFGFTGARGIGRGLPDVAHTGFYSDLALRQVAYVAHLFPPAARWLIVWREMGFPLWDIAFARVAIVALCAVLAAIALSRWFVRTATIDTRRHALCLGLGWYLVTTLPLVTTYFSARHLYPTLAGLAIAAALIAHAILPAARRFALIAMAAVVLLAAAQQGALRPWLEAARLSRAFSNAAQQAARDAEPGSLVFIDAPDLVEGAFCWSWAVPYSLRPPFTPTALDEITVPVVAPGACAFREDWGRQLPLAALAQAAHAAHLLRVRPGGIVGSRVIPVENVRRAAGALARSNADHDLVWERLLAELRAPSPAR